MDRQGSSYMYPDLGFQFPYSQGNFNPVSPYLNFDPAHITQGGPEWIFPEGASRHRGRFELAFSQIGGSVITGAVIGGIRGVHSGLRETSQAGHIGSVRRTQLLNYISKGGAGTANTLGVIAVMYSGFGVIMSWLRGTDDEVNTIAAGTATGLLYRSSAGLRKCGGGALFGFGLSALYCMWTSKDRLKQIASSNFT